MPKYDVVLSFAGQDRQHVKDLVDLLERGGYSFFYDENERAHLWGKDLYVHLSSVYKDQGRYCVMFLSEHYARNLWTNHERENAQARAFRENREYILPVRLDDTEIPGILPTVGYLDLRSITIEEIYEALVKKLSETMATDNGDSSQREVGGEESFKKERDQNTNAEFSNEFTDQEDVSKDSYRGIENRHSKKEKPMRKPLKGFITYSHEDVEKKEELRKHLVVMEQQNELVTWDDGQFTPGDKVLQEDILKEVADSDLLLYLVSAASLASKNCNKELTEALKREIRVIPIILEHCDWLHHQLSGFEVLPHKGTPITKWEDESEGWQNVVGSIRSAISRIRSQTSASSGTSEKELRAELALQHGNVLMMLRQTEVAIKAYSQAIELNSSDANAYSNRSTAYRNNEDLKLAIQDFNRSKQLKPNFRVGDSTEGFVKLEMPLEEALTKITFIVTWLSGEGSDEVIFEGEGVTRYPDRVVLTQETEIYGRTYYENYTLLTQHAVEGNRYIFVPLAQWGGGSGVFLDLNVVDKKTLRTVDEVALGDRTDVRDVVLADAHSETVTITYIKREVKGIEDGYKVVYDPKKAITRYFRMIQGTLQEVEL